MRSVVGGLRSVTLIIVRGDRDEAPVRRYGHHVRSAGPASPALRTAGLAGGSGLAVAATVVVLLTDDPRLLRLAVVGAAWAFVLAALVRSRPAAEDRKSTRLNSSHANISYAVFCLKKKKHNTLINLYI